MNIVNRIIMIIKEMRDFVKQYHINYKWKIYNFIMETLLRRYYFIGFTSSRPRKKLIFKGATLEVNRAPEPTDILWQNCLKDPYRVYKNILIQIAAIVLIALLFCIFLGLSAV
jgi:hypothetical protein